MFVKRLAGAALCVLCICALASAGAWEKKKDYYYEVLPDGTAEIQFYAGPGGEITIPSELDGYRVTVIGDLSFSTKGETLTKVTIPEGIVRIGSSAFSLCEALDSVALPETVTYIGDEAFGWCKSLTRIDIPDAVTEIGENPFACCSALTDIRVSSGNPVLELIDSVLFYKPEKKLVFYPKSLGQESYVVPEGTKSIGAKAFYMCSGLRYVTIPESVTAIGDFAFQGCSLRDVTIPAGVTEIGANPFAFCALANVLVSPDNPVLALVDGVLFSMPDKRLVSYPAGSVEKAYAVPEGTEVIGDYAFYDQWELESVMVPGSVKRIGDGAFYSCGYLVEVTLSEGLEEIGHSAFDMCRRLKTVSIPKSVTFIDKDVFLDCDMVRLETVSGSYARDYARENGLSGYSVKRSFKLLIKNLRRIFR